MKQLETFDCHIIKMILNLFDHHAELGYEYADMLNKIPVWRAISPHAKFFNIDIQQYSFRVDRDANMIRIKRNRRRIK